jgi:membrane peptidoglycan carboxypeptidase
MTQDFQSRPLRADASGGSLRARRPSRPPRFRKASGRIPGGTGIAERLASLRAWARQRGRKRLLRDGAACFGGFLVLYVGYLWITLPDVSDEASLIPVHSSVIVDRNGTELYRLYNEEDRTIIPTEDIPRHMKDAIVAIEDERFYDRGCLDMRAIARAFFRFGQAGGASTLTRQLARNALNLKNDNIINRKLKEIILGCSLEQRYEKDDLLALYLNWIPFGQNAYGVEQASRRYFNTSAKDLSLAQSAIMAALPQRPTYFSPYGKHVRTELTEAGLARLADGDIEDANDLRDEDFLIGLLGNTFGSGSSAVYVGGRTDQVLRNMQDAGTITEEEREAALAELKTITFEAARESIRAPHYVLWVKRQLEEMLAGGAEEGFLSQGGLTIETTLDWELQQIAESIINAKKDDIARLYGANNIALLAADPVTKEILAYVGNVDYAEGEHDGKVDMVQAPRQPGSSFKPLVYASAFEQGFAPGTVLHDIPLKLGTDEPQNFDGSFWGLTNVRRALAGSRNIPAIEAFYMAGGEEAVLDTASRLGAVSPEIERRKRRESEPDYSYGWPLSLGSGETPLLEMVQAYSTLADAGVYKPIVSIRQIKDRRGNILPMANDNAEGDQVIDPRIAYQVTSVLSDAGARPNEFWSSVLSVPGFQAAAKTGTSNKCLERDAKGNCKQRKPDNMWTMGYTPNLVVGVWIGNADATALSDKAEALSVAAPIWKDFMTKAQKELENPKTTFTMPSGLVQPQISGLSGELPSECTPIELRRSDIFLQEKSPKLQDPACRRVEIDKVTNLLASDSCPPEAREMKSFYVPYTVVPPPIDKQVMAWVTARAGTGSLPLPAIPKEKCDISKTPGRLEKPSVTITSPSDGGSATYPSFTPQFSHKGAPIREVLYEVDGKPVARATEAPFVIPIRLPKSIAKSGDHELRVTLTDIYYNVAKDTVDFDFEDDRGGPSIRLTEPEDAVQAGSGFVIRATAEDDEGGIKYVQFFLDDQLLTTKPKEPFTLTYSIAVPGKYEMRAVATDLAGNTSEDVLTITVEGERPLLEPQE